MKKPLFYFGLVLATIFTALSVQAQVTIFSEDLRTGSAPAGWTVNNVTFSTAAGGYANVAATTGEVITSSYDLSAYTSVELTFAVAKFGSGTDGPITVEVSDDGGATFTVQTFDSPIPTGSTYLTSGPTVLSTLGSNVVLRFTTANSASAKRLRDLVLVGFDASAISGCTDAGACNYDALATVDDGSCDFSCLGCTNVLACNYDVAATIDNGTCAFAGDACDDGDPLTTGDVYDGACACAGTSAPSIPNLIITEINYNPNDLLGFPDTNYEFVEIYNNDVVTVDLTGYAMVGVTLTFPAASIAPGEYIVLALNAPFFTGNGYQVFSFTGGLSNSGEVVAIVDNLGNTVNSVTFDDVAPWPISPDGFGPTLELIDVNLDNTLASSWQPSCNLTGSPGAVSTGPCVAGSVETIATIQSTVDVNNESTFNGDFLTTNGIVTAVYPASNLFTIQDGTGAFSGLWVEGSSVAVGDDVTVSGMIIEWFSLTLLTNTTITVNSSGNALPAAELLTTLGANAEEWEGVLVSVTGDVVNGDLGNGEYSLNDASGEIRGDDLAYLATPLTPGDTYTMTGPVYYSFNTFKVEPRDAGDLQKWGCTDIAFPNYDAAAVIDDGSCGAVPGCTNPVAINYDPAATFDDGTCIIEGCTDALALNYDAAANSDNGTCYFTLPNLVINEIHYNPCTAQGVDADFEFLELYNAEATAVNVEGFTFSGITFTFPLGTTLAAGEYVIIAANATTYAGNGYQVFMFTGALGNSGETDALLDAFGNVIDEVTYATGAPWPNANGNCSSLELIDPSLDNSDPLNWQASYDANGTPGAQNSSAPVPTNYTISEIQSDVDANGDSNLAGSFVVTNGVVTAVYASGLYTIQDGTGAYSGLWVQGTGVALGDEVDVVGTLTESFNLTLLTNATATVLTSGNPLPAAELLSTIDISDEQWEGVLIQLTADVTASDLGFGEWAISDGTGNAVIDDLGIALTPVDLGVKYTVTGPNYYSFNAFKLEPRNLLDVQRWGCTDNAFPNFDPLAVIDDGSCGNVPGCTDPAADNYDAAATVDDGSCVYTGCTDPLALNYNALATIEDGSCYFTLPNIVINEIHYNPCVPQGDDFDWEFIELYNAGATDAQVGGFTFTSAITFTFPSGAVIAAGEYVIIAVNAASYAGNGYQVFQNEFGNLSNTSATITLEDGFGNVVDTVTYADTTPWPIAPDGACTSLELIDSNSDNTVAANWQSSYVLYGTPGAVNSTNTPGCTNPTACNYDAVATFDDGSCEFTSCVGCTYPDADNYTPGATQDDGSCTFSFTCPEDLNGDGIINAGDLLQFLGAFGTTCE
jgi:hypothetical protein